jgi:hypothetical protein
MRAREQRAREQRAREGECREVAHGGEGREVTAREVSREEWR